MIELAESWTVAGARSFRRIERPRLGFLGVGWIGCHRLQALAGSGAVDIIAIADAVPAAARQAAALAPEAVCLERLEELFDLDLDGIVIATPSGQHAEHAIAALRHGQAVFCQEPLARNGEETRRVIDAARAANRLLGIDLSYRHTAGMQAIRELIRGGELGRVYGVEMVFHNAYGPDKSWFYDAAQSGGGCLIDLGTHLVDLALWALEFPKVETVCGRLLSAGTPLTPGSSAVEDYAAAQLHLETGTVVQLACSWKAPTGCDACIEVSFFGTRGGARFRNLDGSFYDFVAEQCLPDRTRRALTAPSGDWGGRAVIDWANRLAQDHEFDPEIEKVQRVADTLDAIYQSCS